MAIYLSAASASSLISPELGNSVTPASKLSSLSSVRFPAQILRVGIRNKRINSPSRPRFVPLSVTAKKQSFDSFDDLLQSSQKPVLVDFYATWCGPCQFMVPVLEEVNATLKDKIQVVKIDTEKYPNLADRYQIAALPTFILFKDGKLLDRFEGALPANQLVGRIEDALQVKQ
ncbi:PREDICTED: thioredoxin Y2, chloroplastic [Tarenaya hassleriana]|uniref:thioredoxin Y2, chloroplastic n=1 Tax=Tarenaya hassleriana TaxID=28532 RepID=UPI00053C3484|nr:PREDICTED: thioredoxin Y2, chloroplastic [Tarenaya hassleriana]